MTPDQREQLKAAAQKAESTPEAWPFYRAAFDKRATPSAILSLIAQVEAPTVQQDVIRAAQGDAILGFVQAMIDAGLADSGLMAVAKKIAHVIVISPPVPAIPGTKEGA